MFMTGGPITSYAQGEQTSVRALHAVHVPTAGASYTHTHTHTHVCVYVYIYMCIHIMYMYIYIYMYTYYIYIYKKLRVRYRERFVSPRIPPGITQDTLVWVSNNNSESERINVVFVS